MEFASVVYMIFHLLMPNYDTYKAAQNVEKYYEAVAWIESDNNGRALNGKSTAASYFQVVHPTFKYARERVKTMGYQVPAGQDHILELSYEEQRDLLFVYMYTQKGTNKYMRGIMRGDKDVALKAYLKYHHTKPDPATLKRAKRIFRSVYK